MGKYDKVLKNLPALPPQDAAYQDKVEAVKRQILSPEDKVDLEVEPIVKTALEKMALDVAMICEAMTNAPTQRWASVLMRRYGRLRQVKDHIESHLSEIQLIMTAYEQLVIAQLEAEGAKTIKFDDDCPSFRAQPEPQARIEDPVKFRQWCVEAGLEDSLTLPWPTANSLTKERLVNGLSEPDGVKAYVHTKLVKNANT